MRLCAPSRRLGLPVPPTGSDASAVSPRHRGGPLLSRAVSATRRRTPGPKGCGAVGSAQAGVGGNRLTLELLARRPCLIASAWVDRSCASGAEFSGYGFVFLGELAQEEADLGVGQARVAGVSEGADSPLAMSPRRRARSTKVAWIGPAGGFSSPRPVSRRAGSATPPRAVRPRPGSAPARPRPGPGPRRLSPASPGAAVRRRRRPQTPGTR
jgi:hypothetical protein